MKFFLVAINRHQTEERKITLDLGKEYQGLWKEVFPLRKERGAGIQYA